MIPLSTKRILKKLGGDKETKVLTYDGNAIGKETFNTNYKYVKISDEVIDVAKVTSCQISNVVEAYGTNIVESEGMLVFRQNYTDPNGNGWINSNYPEGEPAVLIVPEDIQDDTMVITKGIYVFSDNGLIGEPIYISSITFETIHPIDPKFLPPMGGGLEVVELTTLITAGSSGVAEAVSLTAEESQKLNDLNGEVCIMKAKVNVQGMDMLISAPMFCFNVGNSMYSYGASIGTLGCFSVVGDAVNGWTADFTLNV